MAIAACHYTYRHGESSVAFWAGTEGEALQQAERYGALIALDYIEEIVTRSGAEAACEVLEAVMEGDWEEACALYTEYHEDEYIEPRLLDEGGLLVGGDLSARAAALHRKYGTGPK